MTNIEKFIETFGVKPYFDIGCCSFNCSGIECEDCTFRPRDNKDAWNREYKEPIRKCEKIKAGDKVKIIDGEEQYTTYNALFNQSKLSKEVISHFKSGTDLLPSLTYTVLEILEHENFECVYIAVIQNNFDDVYLIGVDGLEVVK